MKQGYSFFLFFVLMFFSLQLKSALPPPEIRCVAINSDGSIVISWDTPAGNQAEFINYTIFSSANLGASFQVLDSVTNFNTQSFADVNSIGRIFYFIQTKYDDGNGVTYSLSSDTLSNMILNVTSMVGNNFPPVLNWNPIRTPNLTTNSGTYLIFRKKGFSGNWSLVDSTNYGTETYTDYSIITCSDTLYYRIDMFDDLPCLSTSNIDKELFEEKFPPAVPALDSVSIDTSTGFAKIGWSQSSSPDTEGYIIYYDNNGTWVTDTVFGIGNTYLFNQTVNGNLGSLSFTIAAFDTCGNTSATSSANHTTMFVSTSENLCNREIQLNWSPYEGFSNISSYDIYAAQDNGVFSFVASTNGNTTSFNHSGLNSLSTYCYVVVAKSLGKTSKSNIVCQSFSQLNVPLYHYNTHVTVDDNFFVKAECITDTSADIKRYELRRSFFKNGEYITVDILKDAKDTVLSFIDSTARANQNAYFYRIDAIDSCDQIVVSSNTSRTLFLNIQENLENYHYNLDWNRYQGWDSLGFGVLRYRIKRSLGADSLTNIDSVNSVTLDYTDLYFDIRNEGGTYCYQIEAQEHPNNWILKPYTSLSNKVCLKKEPVVYVPNIFTPNSDGKNDVFLPEIQFVDIGNFKMVIFDRWGSQIFEVLDATTGWDGLIDGTPAPTGGYVYFISFTTPKGSLIEKKGGITLYR